MLLGQRKLGPLFADWPPGENPYYKQLPLGGRRYHPQPAPQIHLESIFLISASGSGIKPVWKLAWKPQ